MDARGPPAQSHRVCTRMFTRYNFHSQPKHRPIEWPQLSLLKRLTILRGSFEDFQKQPTIYTWTLIYLFIYFTFISNHILVIQCCTKKSTSNLISHFLFVCFFCRLTSNTVGTNNSFNSCAVRIKELQSHHKNKGITKSSFMISLQDFWN